MKLLIQSIIFSIAVHVIYFVGSIAYGWFLTKYYVPDIENQYSNISYLQNEITFGYVINVSPIYYVLSFISMSLLGAVIIQLLKKIRRSK